MIAIKVGGEYRSLVTLPPHAALSLKCVDCGAPDRATRCRDFNAISPFVDRIYRLTGMTWNG
jgi:hypothetical protein